MEKNQNNRLIKPQKRELGNGSKRKKTLSSNETLRKVTVESKSKKNIKVINKSQYKNKKIVNKRSRNSKILKIDKDIIKLFKENLKFNKLKFYEILTKLQIGFIIIIVLMILLNKFDIIEQLLEDEISVFGVKSNESNTLEKLATTGDITFEEDEKKRVLGTKEVEFENSINKVNNSVISYMQGSSFDEIFRNTYVVDSRAGIVNSMFDFEAFEKEDLSLTEPTTKEPKVLIFHTHGSEKYIDSKGIEEGVYLLGRTLESELEEKYGISTLHIEKRYDVFEGKTQILGAYERMEPDILAILKKYPSIEVCIDIHRDGLPGDMKQTVKIDGEVYAPLMFVNGLSSYNNKGTIEPLTALENPNRAKNLAFSYRMKQGINNIYNGLMKDIYINAYRYSLHMKPKSLLLEVGAQNNTVAEAVRSTKKFAEILAEVLKGNM